MWWVGSREWNDNSWTPAVYKCEGEYASSFVPPLVEDTVQHSSNLKYQCPALLPECQVCPLSWRVSLTPRSAPAGEGEGEVSRPRWAVSVSRYH